MKIKKIINIFIRIVQVSIIALLAILEYLSEYKAGVMHHLYYKKAVYLSTLYNNGSKMIHISIVMLITLLIIVLYIRIRNTDNRLNIMVLVILSCMFIVMLYMPSFSDLNIYAHMLIGVEVLIGLELVIFICNNLKRESSKRRKGLQT